MNYRHNRAKTAHQENTDTEGSLTNLKVLQSKNLGSPHFNGGVNSKMEEIKELDHENLMTFYNCKDTQD